MFKKLMKHGIILSFLIAISHLVGGCGVYSFSPGGKSSYKTISITPFENKTIESGLATRMTDLVVDAFIKDGNLKVVSADKADAILSGILTSYNRRAKEYDESGSTAQVGQYEVVVVFDISFSEAGNEKPIWNEKFVSEGVYSVDTEAEETGQARAAEKLVVDIINRTTKSW